MRFNKNKKQKKQTIFALQKKLNEAKAKHLEQIEILKKNLGIASRINPNDAVKIKASLYDEQTVLNKIKERQSKLKSKIRRVYAIVGAILTISGGTIAYNIVDTSNKKFDNALEDAYSIVYQDGDKDAKSYDLSSDDLSYQFFVETLSKYVELSKKSDLSDEEKQQLENYKSLIKASPEGMTHLSLDVLKQKIAHSLNIDDPSQIIIVNESTHIAASQTNTLGNGFLTDISVNVEDSDGKIDYSFSRRSFTSESSGEPSITEDSIPKEVLECIYKISEAQGSSKFSDARNALKSVINVDQNDIHFDRADKSLDER